MLQSRLHLDTPKQGSGATEPGQPKFVTPTRTPTTPPGSVLPELNQVSVAQLERNRTPTIPIDPSLIPLEPPQVELGPALTQLQGSVNHLMAALTPEQKQRLHQRGEFQQAAENYEKSVKPWSRAGKVLGVLAAIVVVIFGAGVGYQQFLGGNATKSDIVDHMEKDLVPVRVQVRKNTDAIEGVQGGVTTLLNRGEAEVKVEEAQQVADEYRQEHEERITEWAAAKAAGKRRTKPEKRKELVEAERDVRKAQKELFKVK